MGSSRTRRALRDTPSRRNTNDHIEHSRTTFGPTQHDVQQTAALKSSIVPWSTASSSQDHALQHRAHRRRGPRSGVRARPAEAVDGPVTPPSPGSAGRAARRARARRGAGCRSRRPAGSGSGSGRSWDLERRLDSAATMSCVVIARELELGRSAPDVPPRR
jgi:hypothetical protein